MHGTTRMFLLLAALTGTAASTPAQAQQGKQPAPAVAVNVLATVNGTPITSADVQLAIKAAGTHQGQAIPSDSKAVLDNIITQELIYQNAKRLGIDADPAYQEELRRLETEVTAFKRKKLTEVFLRENARNIKISDAQARAYFTANAAQFRTVYSLSQILRRNEGLINEDFKELGRGVPFEKVAAKQYPNLPPSVNAPWDLGPLRLKQLPAEWNSVVSSLKKGQHSGIIRGPNNRFWIIKLKDKREDTTVSFESAKPMIIEMMQAEKAQQLRETTIRDLRNTAKIVYSKQVRDQK